MRKITMNIREEEYFLLHELAVEQSLMFSTFLRSAIKKFILNKEPKIVVESENTSIILE